MGGIEFRNKDHYLYTGIARNPNGFRELNGFLSYHNESGLPLPERAPPLEDVWFVYDFSEHPWQGSKRGRYKLREQELIGVRTVPEAVGSDSQGRVTTAAGDTHSSDRAITDGLCARP